MQETVDGASGNKLFAVVVVDGDGVDGTDACGELRVELGVFGHLTDEQLVVDLLGILEVGFPVVEVLHEGVPLVDTLKHPDTGLAVVLDLHTASVGPSITKQWRPAGSHESESTDEAATALIGGRREADDMPDGVGVVATVKAVGSEFSEKNVTFMAGSIAYNAFVSLAPLLLVLLLAVRFLEVGLESQVVTLADRYLTPGVSGVVERMVEGDGGTSASVVGIVVALWGSLKIFRNLDTAFSEIFESDDGNGFVDQLRDGLVVLFALLVGVVGMVLATAAFAYVQWIPFVGLLSPLLLVVGLSVAFFPLFYVFPDVDLEPREIVPGVVVAAVGWALLQAAFQVYVSFKTPSDAALLGTLILVVTWLYFSGIVLLLGAVVNAVLTGNAGDLVERRVRESATTETEREFAPNEAAPYLSGLREDVTGRYEGMQSVHEGQQPRPTPTGRVKVEEQSLDTDEGEEWAVTVRYPYDADAE